MATVTFLGNEVKLSQSNLTVGATTPTVSLVGTDLETKTLGGKSDKITVIASVPSLDTPICHAESIKFDEMAKEHTDIDFYVVSKDLPFRQGSFAKEHSLESVNFLSSFRDNEFGNGFGTSIIDTNLKGLDTRAVFVINKDGSLSYQEICSEIAEHPDYDALNEFLSK